MVTIAHVPSHSNLMEMDMCNGHSHRKLVEKRRKLTSLLAVDVVVVSVVELAGMVVPTGLSGSLNSATGGE